MTEHNDFFGEAPAIITANEPHMACLFLLDVSGSMAGTPITELNNAINRFKDDVCKDSKTKEVLDVALVAFNESPRVVQPFTPIEYMQNVALFAGGGTCIAPAVEVAIKMVDERYRFYRRAGSEPYKPWIVMISDGDGGDVTGVAEKIRIMEGEGKLSFRSLGVEGYDSNTLHKLSGKKVMKLYGFDFTGFFDWIHKSMRNISLSSPGEKAKGADLPASVDKDKGTDDWD